MKNARIALGLLIAISMISLSLDSHAHRRSAAAHVHGLGQVNMVKEGRNMVLEVEVPMGDLVGFEHKPKSEVERKQWHQVQQKLLSGSTLFVFPEKAECTLVEAKILDLFEHQHCNHNHSTKATSASKAVHKHEEGHHHHGHQHTHIDVRTHYKFACKSDVHLSSVQIELFQAFMALEKIKVNYVSSLSQSQKTLCAGDREFKFAK